MTVRSMARAGLAVGALALAALAVTWPASAAPPSLTVKGVFDKASYVSGDEISVKFSVHNAGTKSVTGITAQSDFGASALQVGPNGFGVFDDGVTIAAGHTVTVTVSGHLASPAATQVTLAGNLFNRQGNGVAAFSFSAPVAVRTATVKGLVFGDANADGRADPGEALNGVRLRINYLYGQKTYFATTNPKGRFSAVVPRGGYALEGSGSGWQVVPVVVDVKASGADVALRAVKPLGNVLKPTIRFTKHVYAPGDTVHLVVTLTNTGSAPLRGISPACDRAGNPDELTSNGPGWGPLAAGRPGVTLAAHQTKTFDVTDKVPAGAQRFGVVFVACDFGYPDIETGHRPVASDSAKVPGLRGAIAGVVQYFPRGHSGAPVGVAGVRVVLVDPTTCPVFTRTVTTDSDGAFRIAHAPAGVSYKLYLFPPAGWRVVGQNPGPALVIGNDTSHFGVELKHGSGTVPTVPTACASPPPSSPGTPSAPTLSNTGADPLGVGLAGLAVLIAGLVLTLSGRRRAH